MQAGPTTLAGLLRGPREARSLRLQQNSPRLSRELERFWRTRDNTVATDDYLLEAQRQIEQVFVQDGAEPAPAVDIYRSLDCMLATPSLDRPGDYFIATIVESICLLSNDGDVRRLSPPQRACLRSAVERLPALCLRLRLLIATALLYYTWREGMMGASRTLLSASCSPTERQQLAEQLADLLPRQFSAEDILGWDESWPLRPVERYAASTLSVCTAFSRAVYHTPSPQQTINYIFAQSTGQPGLLVGDDINLHLRAIILDGRDSRRSRLLADLGLFFMSPIRL